ncbi:unnamed protein product [Staurois parvus]|uniref:Uncharacterized protein n=1 Tax=Staurois parvus TaxID=386267 RepID=A0ABN9FUE0_9NEOB|nr:unnamed protein product [Staurois parvus]
MRTAAGVYVKLTSRKRSAKHDARCRIGLHRCENPCNLILVWTKKRVLHVFCAGAMQLEPYKMYGSNRTAHKLHVICKVMRCGSCVNHM